MVEHLFFKIIVFCFLVKFMDDASRETKVQFLKFKSETFEHFKIFKVFVEVFMSTKLKTICMNNGGEYKSNEVKNYCDNNGRTHQMTISYMPQQNGVVEQKN